jgi:sugar phosphate isomerase/epimerase
VKETHYSHWISLEPFDYYPDPKTLARESLQYLRRCFDEAGDNRNTSC